MPRRIVIMGAAGRDFHLFNTVFRDDPACEVVAFTAAQIPGIDERTYPRALCGPRYPVGIPIRPESELEDLIRHHRVDEVVFAYSDVSHEDVMHVASRVLATGADFKLIGPAASMLHSAKPVVAVCAVRTGCGKSQTSRRLGRLLMDAGLRTVMIRHPMPYGDLERMQVQRFASLADIDASDPSLEEREEYERPVAMGMVVYAGVDYARILAAAEQEADVIIWDGGNNDLPFIEPDVLITVTDPLRPGHERRYHPGETNLRMADVVVVNKIDTAESDDVAAVVAAIEELAPTATIVRAASPVQLDAGPDLTGASVVVIEDGPTVTHGEMAYGAGTVAARAAGVATLIDPRPFAVGTIADAYARYPGIGPVLPAMGYGGQQIRDLAETLQAIPCDAVIIGTPFDLSRVVDVGHPVRRASYELEELGRPDLHDALAEHLAAWC
ncbi:MAG: cyclic 2,3-diphosphoglycerate synthase [Nitriliruptoraceae bacterium]